MMIDVGQDVSQDAGAYLTYYNRVVSKSEMAKRISLACHPEIIKTALRRWIFGQKPGITLWGPFENSKFYVDNLQ